MSHKFCLAIWLEQRNKIGICNLSKQPARGSVNRIKCEQGIKLICACVPPGMSNESVGGNYR